MKPQAAVPWFALASMLCIAATGCDRTSQDVKKSDGPVTGAERGLTRALGGEPETLDPRLAADNPSLSLMLDLYEGLTTEAPDGAIVPGAAQRWSVSADGLEWSFDLRPGLRWSNGEPLTAVQFAQGIADARATGSHAPYAELLQGVRSMVAVEGGLQLKVQLWRPLPQLPAILALPVAAPAAPSTADRGETVVSNGPYRLLARKPGERIELERNPHFHDADRVAVARVTWLTVDDLNTELNLYRAGNLDVTSEVPNARIDWVRQHLPGQLHVAPYLSTYAYAVNVGRLTDVDARTALAMAIDRPRITSLVTGAGERAAFGWVPPGLSQYSTPRFEWQALDGPSRESRARQLWSAAASRGHAPARLRLCTDASANHRRTAVALIDQWHTVLGVEVELVELEWKAYLAQRERPAQCDLVRFGWSADYVDPEAFLELFESRHPQNTLGYSNPGYDALLHASRRVADPRERDRSLAAAEALLLADVPVIPVFHRVSKRLVKPDVLGVVDNPLGHLGTRSLRRSPAGDPVP